jgi:hypothetical protein
MIFLQRSKEASVRFIGPRGILLSSCHGPRTMSVHLAAQVPVLLGPANNNNKKPTSQLVRCACSDLKSTCSEKG